MNCDLTSKVTMIETRGKLSASIFNFGKKCVASGSLDETC